MNQFFEFEKKTLDGIRVRNNRSEAAADAFFQDDSKASEISYGMENIENVGDQQEETVADTRKEDTKSLRELKKDIPEDAGDLIKDYNNESSDILVEGKDNVFPTKEFISEIKTVSLFRKWAPLSGGMIALVVLGFLVSTVFSNLTIFITPRIDEVQIKDVLVAFDTSVSDILVSQKVIPAQLLEFSHTVQDKFEATGHEVLDEKARGIVKIYNSFSSSPQELVATTRFLTDSGVLFRLPKKILIPGAKIEDGKIVPSFIEAEIIADKSGEESNIEGEVALKIPGFKSTPKYDGFYAVASQGLRGGFKGEAQVVSQDDIKSAQEKVTKKVYDELNLQMARKIPSEFKIIDGLSSIEITSVNNPEAHTRANNFAVSAEALGRVLVFREQDVRNFLARHLEESKVDNGIKSELIGESISLEYRVVDFDYVKGIAKVAFDGSVKTQGVVQEQELASLIKGKKEELVIDVLKNREEFIDFSVAFFPPWLIKAPSDENKIRFITE